MFHTYYFYIALLPSIILHEVSHGWVANYFGDPTAKDAGRLSLNPMRHIDPFGTILLPDPAVLIGLPAFGYAQAGAGQHVTAAQARASSRSTCRWPVRW